MATRIGLGGLQSLSRCAESVFYRSNASTSRPLRHFFSPSHVQRQPLTLLHSSFTGPRRTASKLLEGLYSRPSASQESLRASLRRGILLFKRAPRTEQRWRSWQGSGGGGGGFGGRSGLLRDPNFIVPILIGVNIAICGLWQYAQFSYNRFHDASLLQWMYKNFALTGMNVKAGRLWNMLTSAFSHQDFIHLFMNALGLYFVTPIIISTTAMLVSPRRVVPAFWGLYLGGALASACTILWWHRDSPRFVTTGASGALYAMMGYQVILSPRLPVQLYFFIPMQLRVLIAAITAYDVYNLLYNPRSTTSSEGHLGGLAFGIAAGLVLRRMTGYTPF
ncbi:hypothetical protein BD324DRAFT_638919 [Kockovaella imperatae]|uniref:Peptidase S54 rhomboid domain-containing protein n=1 Tax=Kockovaella imperatae TaxID=4999 RepID=A0A1Y1U768_9TREE|nr:hypothetical protein BD324DRAFT_638919 [Kockovaella imperatae]ORX33871.1 hypothetical protein BD324DRAFT_638919 [Kockovaella imperatae]